MLNAFILYGLGAFVLCLLILRMNTKTVMNSYNFVAKAGGIIINLFVLFLIVGAIIGFFGIISWSTYWGISKYSFAAYMHLIILGAILKARPK